MKQPNSRLDGAHLSVSGEASQVDGCSGGARLAFGVGCRDSCSHERSHSHHGDAKLCHDRSGVASERNKKDLVEATEKHSSTTSFSSLRVGEGAGVDVCVRIMKHCQGYLDVVVVVRLGGSAGRGGDDERGEGGNDHRLAGGMFSGKFC